MTTFTADQKSQLARLMATENLVVEHQKIQTARFDPKNRVLYLPIWQNMSGSLYDLLTGHEVGHALYTPADGWHDAVVQGREQTNYKSFLNVVEDARIEKKVKRRYPGLRVSFQKGYDDLMNRDFFGVKNTDVNGLSFIDRLNLFTKSQYTATWIEFTDFEKTLISKVESLETWEDVLRVTEEIYAYSKDEQFDMQQDDIDFDPDGDIDDFDYSDDSDDFDESKSSDEQTKEEKQEKNGESSNNQSTEETDEGEGEFEGNSFNTQKDSTEAFKDMFQPSCKTDETYRQNEAKLVDEKCKPYFYVEIPKPILSNIVTPAKRVHQLLTETFDRQMELGYYTKEYAQKCVSEFKSKNEKYINLLVKEFEMRKAAKVFSKSKLSDTGDIDINKLSGYKFDDNIFRKMMVLPKGKNHGVVLLLDKSGSMSENMAGSIEQILILSMFCRKVNIPFVVYGFGDNENVYSIDRNIVNENYPRNSFVEKQNNLAMSNVRLREYFNSKMTNSEFNKAIFNMVLVKKSFEGGRYNSSVPRPQTESLSNTPLSQALVATAQIMNEFKKSYNLDLTSLLIVHDGDADWLQCHLNEDENNPGCYRYKHMELWNTNVIICDRENKFQQKMDQRDAVYKILLQWFKKVTGSKVFSFYIVPKASLQKSISSFYHEDDGNLLSNKYGQDPASWAMAKEMRKEIMKKFRSHKFLDCKVPTHDGFYLISGGDDLKIEDEEIEIDGKITSSKLKNAFMKFNKKKSVNRILVSKFIQKMAT